jgi:nucleotidyltransferase/DNA polymerase involved in DNA repair
MHLDLDAFFASVEQKLDPSLIGKPILVGRVDPQGRSVPRGVIATCSYEARAFGCHSGMPLFQALKLCPQAIVVGGHYEEYLKASEKVFSICRRYAPRLEQTGLDEGFLDFSNTDLIYPDLAVVARKIKEEIKSEVGITASIGIAPTKVVAKVASDFKKPDGLTYVEKGQEKKFLSPLSLLNLPGVNTKTYEKIATILIDSTIVKQGKKIKIGDLAILSESFVEERLGKVGSSLWNSANGRDNIWFTSGFGFYKEEVKSISRSETFERNSNNLKFILAKLQALSEEVGQDLRRGGYFGRCVHVTIRYQNFRTVSRQRVLPYPTSLTKEIYEMGEALLKEFWDGHTPLRLVGIGISEFGENIQASLFNTVREKRLELEKRIDGLRERFGQRALVPASVLFLAKRKGAGG